MSNPSDITERRQSERLTLRVPVTCILNDGRGFKGHSADISTGGMSLFGPANLPAGTELRLSFPLPGSADGLLSCRSKVIQSVLDSRTSQFRVGVQFLSPPESLVKTISSHIRSRR
ncbi:PilZ domain-containing protein [Uliginosibacterium paludis]|uniref:PilZ domain-containing protein n=1 Tax=Uliginosibacterium paludis TaxID=1615952 RepID=A0ABV2CNP6_9RHOO